MASLDIVNKVDIQLLDNAVNIAKKEILNRFDFHGSKSEIDLDKKAMLIKILTENDMRMESIIDVIRNRMIKQKLDPSCLDLGKEQAASGFMVRKEIKVREGIDKEVAKKIIKDIKDSKLKVQAQMMDDQVRVTGKKIDDLQAVMSLMRQGTYDLPLQFVNFK
ncbi:MAG: YajQ family cyclic di-GMP-binding protein [Bacteroidetes bacterium RIFCSPLOWO2_12_FULL_35_15]|nr:MAG: YajQ family cyclic di-GMP-binding protein [Bacteroidetes bacterium RIFCSPLOWO2_12_FULL_35_15]